jgi:hypothetical protein
MVGLFTFGMFYPRGNSKVSLHYFHILLIICKKNVLHLKANSRPQGALAGSISSMLVMGWVVFGTQKAMSDGRIKQPVLPVSVEGCAFNVTLPESQT